MVLLTRLYPAPFLNGTLKKSSYGSQTTDYTYNLANMLTEVNNANDSTQISKYTYTYYVDGNQKSKTESVAGTNKGTTNYTYDGLNRLVSEQAPDKTYTYQYDSYGNRSQLSVTGDETYTTSYTYDKNNRMRNQTKTAGTAKEITDFWYDPNGNQISSMTVSTGGTGTAGVGIALVGADNTNSYSEYNSWNQLTRTMQNGKTSSYTYNGDGLRMSKTINGVKTSHIWDGTNIAADVSGSTVTKYIRGLQLISSKKGSNENFYTYNGHGDVIQLTNGTGAITKQYSYDAFGVEIDKADNNTNPFRYCREYYDIETDSVYLRARYYRPTTGRFITEDPIMDGLNWYTYCSYEPVNRIDISGLGWGYSSSYFPKPEIRGLVLGQSSNTVVRDLLFYDSKISDVGCEIIAIHNALFLQNDYGENFIDIMNSCKKISYFENTGWAGCQPKNIDQVLDEYSASYYKTTSYDDMCDNLYLDSVNILSFHLTGGVIDSFKIHTICFYIGENEKVTAYNVYNDQNNYRFYDSVWDFFEKVMPDEKKFIVFYGDIYYE